MGAELATILGWILVALLGLGGLILSLFTLSGTWLAVLAAAVAAAITGDAWPGWKTVLVFAVIAGLVEILETIAGYLGVRRRGGSALAGLAALLGGLAGAVIGLALTPAGSLAGLLLGSCAGAYGIERVRSRSHEEAAHVALGAVIARVLLLVLKVTATAGILLSLGLGLWLSS